jgi:ribonuclease HI
MAGLKIWADGSCLINPGPMRYLVFVELEPPVTVEKPLGHGTNNKAELHAFIKALELAKDYARRGFDAIEILIDSEYVVNQIYERHKAHTNKALVIYKYVIMAQACMMYIKKCSRMTTNICQ